MPHSLRSTLALCILSLLCVGCVHDVEKEASVKTENYNKTPKSIFVIFPAGPRASQIGKDFDETFGQFATNCKIVYGSDYEDKIKKQMEAPKPSQGDTSAITATTYDWALEIMAYKDNYLWATIYGAPVGTPAHQSVTYNFTVTDMEQKAKVWRANLTSRFPATGYIAEMMGRNFIYGQVVAKGVIDALHEDGLLTSCPALPN